MRFPPATQTKLHVLLYYKRVCVQRVYDGVTGDGSMRSQPMADVVTADANGRECHRRRHHSTPGVLQGRLNVTGKRAVTLKRISLSFSTGLQCSYGLEWNLEGS
jgi:5-enolpyruvylshikimate-3-phosphate synthase